MFVKDNVHFQWNQSCEPGIVRQHLSCLKYCYINVGTPSLFTYLHARRGLANACHLSSKYLDCRLQPWHLHHQSQGLRSRMQKPYQYRQEILVFWHLVSVRHHNEKRLHASTLLHPSDSVRGKPAAFGTP